MMDFPLDVRSGESDTAHVRFGFEVEGAWEVRRGDVNRLLTKESRE